MNKFNRLVNLCGVMAFAILLLMIIIVWLVADIHKLGNKVATISEVQTIKEVHTVEKTIEPVALYEAQQANEIHEYIKDEFTPMDIELSEELQEYTYYLCKSFGIDYTFILAVMYHESRFNDEAISLDGKDYGLMQIREINHEWLSNDLGVSNFLDPYQNIYAGIYVYSLLFEKYDGNPSMVLMAYNMGERGANKLWKQGIYESNYSRTILSIKEGYDND